jgi:L-threonylcarbamoyladenylate synthase
MDTLRLVVDTDRLESPEVQNTIDQAAEILRSGGLVALPTETVYGLGANAFDPVAVVRIFAAKERPTWDPIIVHIAGDVEDNPMLAQLVSHVSEPARRLMTAFWPGPLTLLLPRSAAVPDAVTAGRHLVGVRMPAHPVAFELIRRAGVPVAAPSANIFSHTSPTTADHVLEDLDGRIHAVLDAGSTKHGLESTVIDPNQVPMVIYRPGAITEEQIRAVAGPVETYHANPPSPAEPISALPSPGVGIRHYAPHAKLILIDAPLDELPRRLAESAALCESGQLGMMLPAELISIAPSDAAIFPWGRWSAPQELGHSLYAGLRDLDAQGCTVIICPVPPDEGIGAAIRDRLLKASTGI